MGVGLKGIRIIRFLRNDGFGGRWTVDKVDQVDDVDMDKVDYEINGSVYLDVHPVHCPLSPQRPH